MSQKKQYRFAQFNTQYFAISTGVREANSHFYAWLGTRSALKWYPAKLAFLAVYKSSKQGISHGRRIYNRRF